MKRKINRIMIISMLFGFCINPTILKSQLIQSNNPISLLLETDSQSTLNNWFSLNHFFESDWSSDEKEAIKADSLKKALELKSKVKSSNNSAIPKLNRSSSKKMRKKNFRNMQVVIQTRI